MIAKKVNEKDLRKKLIIIYEAYIEDRLSPKIREIAGNLYGYYLYAGDIIDQTLYGALCPLDGIAWPEIIEKTSRPPFPKEEAKKLLEELKKNDKD